MKRIYIIPKMKTVDIKPTTLLDGSGDTTIQVYTDQNDPTIAEKEEVW